jgi:hypothetical protein
MSCWIGRPLIQPSRVRVADALAAHEEAKEVKSELRKGLYHVVVAFPLTDGGTTWESCAKFSRPDKAEDAIQTIRRLVVLEN